MSAPTAPSDPSPAGPEGHDTELAGYLESVVSLSAERSWRGPEAFLEALEQLGREFAALRGQRSEAALGERLLAFAQKRFELVDEPDEYALACEEVLVLSMALGSAAPLSVPALKHALAIASTVLAEERVPPLFRQLLQRLRYIARQQGDTELAAWVRGVVSALPSD